ncbi:MAG TPA: hypothetical protein VNM92_14330 [Thermoanaerobaculia bacterium]|nr:hypothetical protein [Thermoanaerobaculia bacterium]
MAIERAIDEQAGFTLRSKAGRHFAKPQGLRAGNRITPLVHGLLKDRHI